MGSSTTKKVLVQRFDRQTLTGFVNSTTFVVDDQLELLSLSGAVSSVPLSEIKTVCFVRDFAPASDPLERRAFQSRPKVDGVWLRLTFRDGDLLEGIIPNNLLQLSDVGFNLLPPSTQRVFVPRAALREVQVLGVVNSPLRTPKRKAPAKEQIGLFEEQAAENA